MVEPALAYTDGEFGKLIAAANKQETEGPVAAQPLSCGKHRCEFVPSAEIAGIADDEPVCQSPFTAQVIVERRYRPDLFVIAPVRDDPDPFRRDAALAEDLRHAFADHDIDGGRAQRGV